jgi:hypothetical protein
MATITLSVRSCRTIRPPLAPMARRMATSRPRVAARASDRFATFAQASSRTAATTDSSRPATETICARCAALTWETDEATSVRGGTPGRACARTALTGASDARACATVTAGLSRPRRNSQLFCRLRRRSGSISPEYPARGGRMTACIIIGT